MNQSLHGLLHRCTRWRDDLVVVGFDSTGWHLVETLVGGNITSAS
jgi:hypothetical protein